MPVQRQEPALMSHLRAAAPGPPPPATGHRQPIRHRLPSWPLTPPQDPEQSLPVAASSSRTDLKIAQIGGSYTLSYDGWITFRGSGPIWP